MSVKKKPVIMILLWRSSGYNGSETKAQLSVVNPDLVPDCSWPRTQNCGVKNVKNGEFSPRVRTAFGENFW